MSINNMPRPRKIRKIRFNPEVTYYKPAGVPMRELEEVEISKAELEAIRLNDFKGLDQTESSEKMNISQPTLHRILLSARKKIAEALVKGKAIKIE
jgi:predicted DNA-binding protein (UPF0251 family)